MNRTTGGIPKPNFKDFCILIRLAGANEGFCYQEVIRDTSPRFALGKAFGKLRKEGLTPAESDAVFYFKISDEMTADERFMWGVQTADDEIRAIRRENNTRYGWDMLDHF